MTVTEYLHNKGIQYKRRGDTAIFNCVFCDDKEKKFGISLIDGSWNCLRLNHCGRTGNFSEFQVHLGDKPIYLHKKDTFINRKEKTYVKPKTIVKSPTDKIVEYLKRRGFNSETIEHFRFGAENDDTVMIPYYRNGELINVKYRSITDKKKMRVEKDAEAILFNRDNIYDDKLTICEGEYDAAALYQYGIDATSVPNGAQGMGWVDTEWEYLETFSLIYLCFDNDAAGQKGARDLAVRLGEWRCQNVIFPYKDANECLTKAVPKGTVQECFAKAADFSPETLVAPMFFHERVQNLFKQGTGLFGIPTPWEELNAILKGWRPGEVTVWSGRNGSGKSTILNQVFIELAKHSIASCIYSGEMPPERYLRWAIIQYQQNNAPSPDKIQSTLKWMSEKVYILNVTAIIDPEKLLNDFEYAARRYGVKHFIVDSLMKVKFKDSDEYRQQQDFVSRLCGFVQKFDSHIHLVAHPRKTESDDDETGKVDVKGSSHITDLCHNVIVLFRVSEKKKEALKAKKVLFPADMKLFIKKNREFGIEGSVNMTFNEATKTFSDGG